MSDSVNDVRNRIYEEFGSSEARYARSNSAHMESVSADKHTESSIFDEIMASHAARTAFFESPLPHPEKTRIIAVSNQKGGVGKTTSAVNLAAALAEGGLDTLVIDADPQGNASTALGVQPESIGVSMYQVLRGENQLSQAIRPVNDSEHLWVAPSTIELAGIDMDLIGADEREFRLNAALNEYLNSDQQNVQYFDYIFIDSPPSLGVLTLNALVAAQEVLIPIQAEYYALEGLTQLMKTIEKVRASFNSRLHISTIVLTMFDKRTNLANDVAADVENYFPNELLHTRIPRNVRISEAPSFGQTVIHYDPRSAGTAAYLRAAQELAQRAQQ